MLSLASLELILDFFLYLLFNILKDYRIKSTRAIFNAPYDIIINNLKRISIYDIRIYILYIEV